MKEIKKIIEKSRYLEGQIAFPNNGQTHILSTKELYSLLQKVAEAQRDMFARI